MTRFNKGAILRISTASRTFTARAAKSFNSDFDMIYPVYDMDRGGCSSPCHGRKLSA